LNRSRDLRLRMTFRPRPGSDYFILGRDGRKGGSSVQKNCADECSFEDVHFTLHRLD
jgi:hypothetical protein